MVLSRPARLGVSVPDLESAAANGGLTIAWPLNRNKFHVTLQQTTSGGRALRVFSQVQFGGDEAATASSRVAATITTQQEHGRRSSLGSRRAPGWEIECPEGKKLGHLVPPGAADTDFVVERKDHRGQNKTLWIISGDVRGFRLEAKAGNGQLLATTTRRPKGGGLDHMEIWIEKEQNTILHLACLLAVMLLP